MATKPKAKTTTSFLDDDLLDSLFDDKKKKSGGGRAARDRPLTHSSGDNNIFSMLAEEVNKDGVESENSDVSAADPDDILKNIKDMDDMDADLFPLKKKPSSAPAQTKHFGNEAPKQKDSAGSGDDPSRGDRKLNSAPSATGRKQKKFSFSELDDPVLDSLLPDETKSESRPTQLRPVSAPSESPVLKRDTVKKKPDVLFDESDDHMEALGFDSDTKKKKESPLWSSREKSDAPQRPRTRIHQIEENLLSPRLLERPATGERKEAEDRERDTSTGKDSLFDDGLSFGSYQPTVVSTPEGRQSRRQSVRFFSEDVGESKPRPSSSRHRGSADWLGLKTNDDDEAKETKPSPPPTPSSPLTDRKTSSAPHQAAKVSTETPAENKQTKMEAPKNQPAQKEKEKKDEKEEEKEEEDWLSSALSRRKTRSRLEESSGFEEKVDPDLRNKEEMLPSIRDSSPAAHSTPMREEKRQQDLPPAPPAVTHPPSRPLQHQDPPPASDRTAPPLVSLPSVLPGPAWYPQQSEQTTAPQQLTVSADSLQQLLLQQQLMQTQLLGLGGAVPDPGVLHRLKDPAADHQALQARIIQLEGQVKTLQLERDQSHLMLENIQQQHRHSLELLENTHRSRVKLLEDSAAQREAQMQRECEDLMERLAAASRSAEQERTELQTQYQRKVAQTQQDRDREVERLRDLQRKSILEMKKDHEDQIQRLKKLKDEEIDAVTSATSQTRSLTGVIEQMEAFSSRLGDLSSRVESTHEHTAQGLEQGARHRDEQLRAMQERLLQQQAAMAEERAYLKEIISRMDTQLNEQQRQLEKERWKVTAEQAKAESTQRGLEEERRVLTLQSSMEREELERAKSALLEEQKSVMQHCADERRKLAAEWANFHAQEKARRDRAEQEVSSLLERREGSILSLAQEQADLKLRSAELKRRETDVAQERETLDRLREELEREKEKMSSSALRLKARAQEVEAFSKLAADKYSEGERALLKARRVEDEHEARLRHIQSQTERLRQQEQRMLKEQMRLNHLQVDTDRLRPNISPHVLPDPVLSSPDPPPVLTVPPPTTSSSCSQSLALQASLALWKYTAERDREFLKEEQMFLENLKRSSNRWSFNTD